MNLTPRQHQVLTYIRQYRDQHGYSPRYGDIANSLDISKPTVYEHVLALIKKGLLSRDTHKARSLKVIGNIQLPDELATYELDRLRMLNRKLLRVARQLDTFQRRYSQGTGISMPGNTIHRTHLTQIVRRARIALDEARTMSPRMESEL